jgi:hypothetical protein
MSEPILPGGLGSRWGHELYLGKGGGDGEGRDGDVILELGHGLLGLL